MKTNVKRQLDIYLDLFAMINEYLYMLSEKQCCTWWLAIHGAFMLNAYRNFVRTLAIQTSFLPFL